LKPGGTSAPDPGVPANLNPGTKKPTPMTELAPASLPVWLDPLLLRLRLRQAVALVLYVNGDLGQRLGVLAAVVRTEKQLS
jgi:hypothetical protein